MEVVLVAPTNVVVPSTTSWIDHQATSFGSMPDVCARSGCSCCWPVVIVARRIVSVNPAKEDTTPAGNLFMWITKHS